MKTSMSEMIKVMRAYEDGKQIQVNIYGWEDCPHPKWNWGNFDYRIATEREIDWTKVPKDTKVLVWDNAYVKSKAYFCHYHDGKIFVYEHGRTSWTSNHERTIGYNYCELAEPAKEEWYK